MAVKNLYPEIESKLIKDPNRFYAVPLIGGFVKIIMLIPVVVELFFVQIAAGILTFLNSFVVLFTGSYWKPAYELNLGVISMTIKIAYFFSGLTDTYPGFSLQSKEIPIKIALPVKPNRLFAIPIFGGLARIVLLIPFLIYMMIIQRAAGIGMVVSSIPVLFTGKYPESTYELMRDSVRLTQAVVMYTAGLADTYPTFWISMNHKVIKWILIILSILFMLNSYVFPWITGKANRNNMKYQYQYPSSYPSAQNSNSMY